MAVDTHAADGHHGLVQHQFDDLNQQRECMSLGMWSFLATEAMMFGGLFLAYTVYRWAYPFAYEMGSHHLDIKLGTINTFVLLFSSLTMAIAVRGATTRQRKTMLFCLVLTFLLGAAFIGIKAVEWHQDYQEGLIPAVSWHFYNSPEAAKDIAALQEHGVNANNVQLFFVIYFCMAGLHAIHMLVGLGLVGTLWWLGRKGQFTNGNDQPVELVGLYWHLIDIIWVFLFPLLYLIAGFHAV